MSAVPTIYARQENFDTWQINNPSLQYTGLHFEYEYNDILRWAVAIQARLAEIQNDDGTIRTSGLDHDALTNFVANEHIDWTVDAATVDIHSGNIGSIPAGAVTAHEAALTILSSQLTETSTKKVMTDVERTKLTGIEASATADQSASEIETAYNAQVAAASEAEARAGTEAAIRRFSPLRISQAIDALAAAGAPAAHAASHASGGSDAVKLDDLAATDDNTDLDATASAHGLMSKLDKTKLDGIETGATEDQSNSEIKTAYETNADTNAFTDTEKTKLSGIEASATEDQTASEIESNYNAQVAEASQTESETGTETAIRRFSPLRISQAIAALAGAAGQVYADGDAITGTTTQVSGDINQYHRIIPLATTVITLPTGGSDGDQIAFNISNNTSNYSTTLELSGGFDMWVFHGSGFAEFVWRGSDWSLLNASENLNGAKGDMTVGIGGSQSNSLPVGTDTHVLTADSTETSGVKWAAAAAHNHAASEITSGTLPPARLGAASIDSMTEIHTDLKTGADIKLCTGTAGTPGNLAVWGTFGDVRDGGVVPAVAKEIGVAVSNEASNLVASTTTVALTFRMPYAMTLTAVRASVTTAPTGSIIIVDINEAGANVLSTYLSIDINDKTSVGATSTAVISNSALADDAEITVYIRQAGSTIPGTGLKLWLIGTLA